jgi:hypothetical protein
MFKKTFVINSTNSSNNISNISKNFSEKNEGVTSLNDYYDYSYLFVEFIIIVAFGVCILDKVFYILSQITLNTPFHDLIKVIEKELMIVGFISLLFKFAFDSRHIYLSNDSIHGFEFAG